MTQVFDGKFGVRVEVPDKVTTAMSSSRTAQVTQQTIKKYGIKLKFFIITVG